jgi:hypothetical protein
MTTPEGDWTCEGCASGFAHTGCAGPPCSCPCYGWDCAAWRAMFPGEAADVAEWGRELGRAQE